MAIGTSDGKSYEDELAFHLNQPIEIPEQVKPNVGIPQATKPNNIEDQVHSNPNYYDEPGFQASGMAIADNGHRPDTFKLPQHITFSNESKYHGVDGNEGGQWKKLDTSEDGQDRWSFTPGATNFKHHSLQEMQDYFKKYETGNVLNAQAAADITKKDVPPLPIQPNTEIKLRSQQTKEKYEQIMRDLGLPMDKKTDSGEYNVAAAGDVYTPSNPPPGGAPEFMKDWSGIYSIHKDRSVEDVMKANPDSEGYLAPAYEFEGYDGKPVKVPPALWIRKPAPSKPEDLISDSGKFKLAADVFGQGADLSGSYLPDSWNKLSKKDKEILMHERTSKSIFGEDYSTAEDLKDLVDKHGQIEFYPYHNPEALRFLENADPNVYERFNTDGDKRGERTITIRKKNPLVA